MTAAGPTVNMAYYRLPNIDIASGYVQLSRYLADKTTVRIVEPARVPDAISRRIAARASGRLEFYEPAGVRLELAVLRRLLMARDEVCHLLYGEDHFNHLARVRHLPRRFRGTLVATFHQPPATFERVVRLPDLRRRLRALDAAIVLSGDQAEMFRDLMPPERVHLVPHGVNAFHFHPPAGPAPEPVRCLMVGAWLRDFGTLRDAIARVAAEDPSIRFDVVTSRAHAGKLAGAPSTDVRSEIPSDELLAAYHSAHLFLHPVTAAAGNNALAEALACGLPVVATGIGGVPEFVDERAAVLMPPGDAGAMAAAILSLARDPERRARMSATAREVALRHDWPHVAWETMQVYAAAARHRAGALGA